MKEWERNSLLKVSKRVKEHEQAHQIVDDIEGGDGKHIKQYRVEVVSIRVIEHLYIAYYNHCPISIHPLQ